MIRLLLILSHTVFVKKGKLAEQKTVVTSVKMLKDRLAYWLANRMDQLAFLTLSGVSYAYANNGAARTSGAFASLAFAADVEAPTSKRHRRWDSTLGLQAADTTAVDATDVLTYKACVDMVVYAKNSLYQTIECWWKRILCSIHSSRRIGTT